MIEIKSIINLLSSADNKAFIRHLGERNKRKDNKNISLFKALLVNKEGELKEEIGSNAFLVLKKRLYDRLIDFAAGRILNSEANVEISIIKKLLIARKLLTLKEFKPALKLLTKAKGEAKAIQHFSLLNEIFHTKIEYSHHFESLNQEELFHEFLENQKANEVQEKLNMAYAVIRKAFKQVEFQSGNINFQQLFNDTFKRFGVSDAQAYSFKSLYQLAEIANIQGSYRKDFYSVNLLFIDKLSEIQGGPDDKESSIVYHINLLYLIANIYFRKKEFKQSMFFLKQMKEQTIRFNSKYQQRFELKYFNLLALNLNFSNNYKEATVLLEELIQLKTQKHNDLLNSYLILTMIHFQQGRKKEAQQLFLTFQHTDHWYETHMGLEWALNKRYIEILLHIELGNTDYVDSRIQSLIRTHGKYLKTVKEFQVLSFLKLIKMYYHSPGIINSKKFSQQVETGIEWKPSEQEDLFLMCFYAWLKAKMINEPLYKVTLEIINER